MNDADYFKEQYKLNDPEKAFNRFARSQYSIFKKLNRIAPINYKDFVVEVGSGYGGILNNILHHTKNACSIEPSKFLSKFLMDKFKVDVYDTPIELTDFPSESIDKIYMFEVLEHLKSPIQTLETMFSWIKPGGYLIGTTPFPFLRDIIGDSTHLFVLHPKNWERHFINCGFVVDAMGPATLIPYVHRFNRVFSINLPLYIPFSPFVSTTYFVLRKPT
ncbi:MAG: hypothetical protein EoVTN8_395 [Fluviibacter phosphoraccumulans EoVTN8]